MYDYILQNCIVLLYHLNKNTAQDGTQSCRLRRAVYDEVCLHVGADRNGAGVDLIKVDVGLIKVGRIGHRMLHHVDWSGQPQHDGAGSGRQARSHMKMR